MGEQQVYTTVFLFSVNHHTEIRAQPLPIFSHGSVSCRPMPHAGQNYERNNPRHIKAGFRTRDQKQMTLASNNTGTEKPFTSVMEDYLEAIYDLEQDKKVVRVKDIAKRMNVKMPTVTSMLKTLSDRGLVHYEKYEYVELTDQGAGVGREMRRRHEALLQFLTTVLKIDHHTADQEACLMEHALSANTLEHMTDFMAFVKTCPQARDSCFNQFEAYRRRNDKPEGCTKCSGGVS